MEIPRAADRAVEVDRSSLDEALSVKVKLAGLWITMILLYAYADILSLYRPGEIIKIESGRIGPFDVSQSSLLVASLVVIVPTVMVALSLTLRATVNRPANLVVGFSSGLVNLTNLVGESWIYYFLFGGLELALSLSIVVVAWRWPRRAALQPSRTDPPRRSAARGFRTGERRSARSTP